MTLIDEIPGYVFDEAPSRICSCDDLIGCISIAKSNFSQKKYVNRLSQFRIGTDKNKKIQQRFRSRRPSTDIRHLSVTFDKTDLILPSESDRIALGLKQLAIEGDFISHRIAERRNSS